MGGREIPSFLFKGQRTLETIRKVGGAIDGFWDAFLHKPFPYPSKHFTEDMARALDKKYADEDKIKSEEKLRKKGLLKSDGPQIEPPA